MAGNFYELTHFETLGAERDLRLPRAKALLEAIKRHRDFSVVAFIRLEMPDTGFIEGLIVDIELDGVPPKNPYGIKYRERLALVVPDDEKELVRVWALRKDFPILIHLNQHAPDTPADLCLYFGPPSEVFRTWTPQNFLRRIQWWLEKSARGELHPADQPVEQLFFRTKYELVLPWNIDELRNNGTALTIFRSQARPDEGFTCFIKPAPQGGPEDSRIAHIELTLPPVLQGTVERDPAKLGHLADVLANRGSDLIDPLKSELKRRIPQEGISATADGGLCVILLNIPICRSLELPPEKFNYRAFILLTGALKLGEAMGVCFKHEGKYFNAAGVIGAEEPNGWQDTPIFAMDVRRQNSKADARQQSGIGDAGPSAVLIGAGSLGSTMLNLWGRSGWGDWTVIDKDHIKPHNLSRHVALSCHIGEMKAHIVADLHDATMGSASSIQAIVEDACDTQKDAVSKALQAASLIVDASTTLEYPRLASTIEHIGRHASVFVTPNGKSAVLLVEDADRRIRLRSLEAQYYRALIRYDWGATHLDGNLSTFWSGASCRDLSFVLPYSSITLHASNLAEQIRFASYRTTPTIKAWEHQQESGSITAYEIEVAAEKHYQLDDFTLYMDAGIENDLYEMRAGQLPNETGGVLLGYYDLNLNSIIIVDALAAPPDSKSSPQSFERGIANLAEKIAEVSKRTAGIVGYVGEWHSHPKGIPAQPSGDDLFQLAYLTLGMADDGLPAVQIIVGDGEMSILQGVMR